MLSITLNLVYELELLLGVKEGNWAITVPYDQRFEVFAEGEASRTSTHLILTALDSGDLSVEDQVPSFDEHVIGSWD